MRAHSASEGSWEAWITALTTASFSRLLPAAIGPFNLVSVAGAEKSDWGFVAAQGGQGAIGPGLWLSASPTRLSGRSCGDSGSLGRRWLGGQGASHDLFALRMHAVAKRVENEAVRTGCSGFHQTLCELGYVTNPRGATIVQDRLPQFRSWLRQGKPLVELFVGWHYVGNDPTCSQRCLWENFLIAGSKVARARPRQRPGLLGSRRFRFPLRTFLEGRTQGC